MHHYVVPDSCKSTTVIVCYTKYLHHLIKPVNSEVITSSPSTLTNIIINITWHYVYSKLEKLTVSTGIGTREKISTETMWQPF